MFSITQVLLLLLLSLFAGVFFWLKQQKTYWKRNRVPYIPPSSVIWGNLKRIIFLQENVGNEMSTFYYDKKTKNSPYVGIYSLYKPMLMIKDPELIKNVLIKDFNLFADRHTRSNIHTDSLSYYNLFFLRNPLWKDIRSRLTPTFTSGKIKQMFYLMNNIGDELSNYMESMSKTSKTFSADIKDICAKYTTDSIVSCAFGLQANSISDPNSEFRMHGKELVNFTWWRGFEFISFFFFPELVRLFGFKIFTKEVSQMLRRSISDKIQEREQSGITRNDFIDTMITLRNEDKDAVFKGDVLLGQAAAFFIGGFETSSATMSFALYEIAMQPEIQKRLRQDIKECLINNNGKFTYDSVQNMDYLDMVLKETLRLYPILPFLDRISALPNDQKGYSLEPFGNYTMPSGMPVIIPIYSLHTDPKYFPDPFKFDPERFSPENRDNINPYIYLPFGRGPRNCIGDRFAILQSKVGLLNILKNHFVTRGNQTIKEMHLDKKALLLQAEGGINLNCTYDPII